MAFNVQMIKILANKVIVASFVATELTQLKHWLQVPTNKQNFPLKIN